MTTFEEVYSQFLSSVPEMDFGGLSDDEIKKELSIWLKMAIADFLFPQTDLSYQEHASANSQSELVNSGTFVNRLSQREINVLLAYMRVRYFAAEISKAKRFDRYYYDANMRLASEAPLLAQLNRSLENARQEAKEAAFNYGRKLETGEADVGRYKW